MTGPSWSTFRRYDQCVAGMIADPDCHGDLLLIGLALARATILGDPPLGLDGTWTCGDLTAGVFSARHQDQDWRARDLLRRDVPRYDLMLDPESCLDVCGAPMIRRSGTCGARTVTWVWATNVDTGRRYRLGCCRRHQQWWAAARQANIAAVKAAGDTIPTPPQNAGGVLARHIRGINWPKLYRSIDANWVEPPTGESFTPPKLRLLTFDAAGRDEAVTR